MKISKKLKTEISLVILVIGFSMMGNVFAMPDPGDGGGGSGPNLYITPHEIIVNPEDNPINEEITLSWFVSQQQYYDTFFTLIYKNRNGQGWQYLGRIDGDGYKEFIYSLTEIGNYEFMVRIYAQYRYNDYRFYIGPFYLNNDQDSVICARGFRGLLGSVNRTFPNIEESRLGYTINTTWVPLSIPYISFSIYENRSDTIARDIRVYVDGIQIFEINYDIPTGMSYPRIITAPELGVLGSHVIEIEIYNGLHGSKPHYILEYFNVSKIEFEESKVVALRDDAGNEITRRFSPTLSYYYNAVSKDDKAYVCVNTIPYYDNDDLISKGDNKPDFRSIIEAFLDPDIDTTYFGGQGKNYVYSMGMQWRVLSPEGYYLSYNLLHYSVSLSSNNNGVSDFPELDWILLVASLSVSAMGFFGVPPYITFPLGAGFSFATVNVAPATIDWGNQGDNAFYGSWTADTYMFWGDESLNPQLDSHSIIIDWSPELPSQHYGSYQIEITWFVDIRLDTGGWGGGTVTPVVGFPKSDTFYLNVQYLEND